jgi:hypothetical protein
MGTVYARSTSRIVDDLRDLADALEALGPVELTETAVSFDLQVASHGGDEETRTAIVTDLCERFLDIEVSTRDQSNLFGTPVFGVNLGCINVDIFTGVRSSREIELAAEVERLRKQLAEPAMGVPSEERLAEIEAETAEQHGPVDECEDCEDLAGA